MSSWQESWVGAETSILGFFRDILEGSAENSFIGELPKDFQYSEEAGMFMFSLTGGGQPLDFDFNMNTPGSCGEKEFLGMLEGVWTSREEAQRMASIVMDNLPIPENQLTGIRRIRPTENPSLERVTIPRRSDQEIGGDMRVWQMTCPMLVLFTKEAGDG